MATKNTDGRKTITINKKEVTFCFNHNSQITKALDANGNPIEDDGADPWTKILQDMPRYNDGTAYSKPQPRVKIGNEVIKLGNRYMTPAEKEEVKGYNDGHSTGGSGSKANKINGRDVYDKLTALIDKMSSKKGDGWKEAAALVEEFRDDNFIDCLSLDELRDMLKKNKNK